MQSTSLVRFVFGLLLASCTCTDLLQARIQVPEPVVSAKTVEKWNLLGAVGRPENAGPTNGRMRFITAPPSWWPRLHEDWLASGKATLADVENRAVCDMTPGK